MIVSTHHGWRPVSGACHLQLIAFFGNGQMTPAGPPSRRESLAQPNVGSCVMGYA